MALTGTDAPGATPLEQEDIEELIPDHIETRAELDEWEAQNITHAIASIRRPNDPKALLDDKFLRRLHHKMFGDTWTWAGEYRLRETNLGVAPFQIAISVRNLCEDVKVWQDQSVFSPDELAVRFHHRLVSIHPFRNGNGRHSRLAADLLIQSLEQPRFAWGRSNLVKASVTRQRYLDALRQADKGHIEPLLAFARSHSL